MRRASLPVLLIVVGVCASRAGAQTPEPPPEAGEGDYTFERADSLGRDELEWSVGASRDGGAARRLQRVSFRGDGAQGVLRDGRDALAGGRMSVAFLAGELSCGRLAPRWGRGLVLGGADDPWRHVATERGERAAFRARSGEGIAYRHRVFDVTAARFGDVPCLGTRLRRDAWSLGVLANAHEAQGSLAFDHADRACELVLARHGRWRAEAALTQDLGAAEASLRVRGGVRTWTPLAEPALAGPPQALGLALQAGPRRMQCRALAALWRWPGGRTGARGALEVTRDLGHHETIACGLEQQHGARRDPSSRTRPMGARQGLWVEWRGGAPGTRLTLRHELWGTRAWAREAVRRALVARLERDLPRSGRIAVTHAVWDVRRGEVSYLPEPAADRLVLRALAGRGERSRIEVALPMTSGEVRLGLAWVTGGTRGGTRPPTWTIEWVRRSRLARTRAGRAEGSGHEVRGADGIPEDRGVVRHARAWQGARGAGPQHRASGDR